MHLKRIVVDWGTSNFRAWLVDATTDRILDEIVSDCGMSTLSPEEFPDRLKDSIRPWLTEAPLPIYMSGMVGAAQGWQQTPQLPLPIDIDTLADNMVAANGVDHAWIIPGVRVAGSRPDVMRGEEVQIFGALSLAKKESALLCLPGTHSKWSEVDEGKLTRFDTNMTGELFDVLMAHSIIGRSAEAGSTNTAAFDRGLNESQGAGGLLNQLFTTRSRFLYDGLKTADVQGYVSGLLIGSEVLAMKEIYVPSDQALLLVCSSKLRDPYQRALNHFDFPSCWIDARLASLKGTCLIIDHHGKS